MPDASGDGERFDVHCSAAVAKELKRLTEGASPSRRKLIAAAFRQIVQKLQTDPMNAGEPLYRLAGLRMQVRMVVVIPLMIDFAVSEDRPLVFIKNGKLLGTSVF